MKKEVAEKRIDSIESSLNDINKKLHKIHKTLTEIENTSKLTKILTISEESLKSDYQILNKLRNILGNTPPIIFFKMFGMFFYIEFTIRYSKNEKYLEGCFVYGTSYFNEKGIVIDKPILCFSIGDNGIIVSENDFENESWLDNKIGLTDLHKRALDKVWEEALYEINFGKIL